MAITSPFFFAPLSARATPGPPGTSRIRISQIGCSELSAAQECRRHILLNMLLIIYNATWMRSGSRASRRR